MIWGFYFHNDVKYNTGCKYMVSINWYNMSVMASQIIGNSVNCSTPFWSWQTRQYQNSTLLSLCKGNPLESDGFISHRDSNEESVLVPWRHYDSTVSIFLDIFVISSGLLDTLWPYWPSDTYVFFSKQCYHCFRKWLVTCSEPSLYLNQFRVILNKCNAFSNKITTIIQGNRTS